MIEQFYAIGHLTTEQLRELFSSNRNRGWVDYEYYKLMPEGGTPPELTDEEILFNMDTANPHNYFVFMLGMEDEPDGNMELLDEIVKKYKLEETGTETDRLLFTGGADSLPN